MLDIKMVRENTEIVDKAMEDRNSSWDKLKFLKLDEERRAIIGELEKLQHERNTVSKKIGELMREGKKDEAEQAKKTVSKNKDRIDQLSSERTRVDIELKELLSSIPNIPSADTPVGKDEDENVEVSQHGTPREFDFEPKAHWDLGVDLNIIDFERGVKLAGSRFALLGGKGAALERALINFMLDYHLKRGYKEWWPPVIGNTQTLYGTGQLPKFEEDLFHADEDFYLIPTAEVMLTNIHSNETLDAEDLTLNYCAYTPCFRQEAGSAGRDTRGLIRLHQFDKVEMVKIAKPEDSEKELQSMVESAGEILELLELPYRILALCTGDIGFSAEKTFDLEVWLPSYNDYKEISSCSNCSDFQARRANIKYKDPQNFKGSRFVHTLNGSGLAVGRTMAALIENHQNADGSVTIPEALKKYMNGLEVITPEK